MDGTLSGDTFPIAAVAPSPSFDNHWPKIPEMEMGARERLIWGAATRGGIKKQAEIRRIMFRLKPAPLTTTPQCALFI